MVKKANTGSNPISDSEILAIYEVVISLLSDNPEALDITDEINKWLSTIVPYNFCHFLMEDPPSKGSPSRLQLVFEKWGRFGPESNEPAISMHPTTKGTGHATFDEEIERNYQSAIDRSEAADGKSSNYHYHRIETNMHPRIVIGLFRYKNPRSNNDFTPEEKNIFFQLTPHLVSLFRAVLMNVYLSQGYQYFDAFAQLASNVASDYLLSDSEVRLIPDILFGYSNEEIADRQFISIPTVKSHIQHILKKTGTKNRIDFIGKFFTSPEHVQL